MRIALGLLVALSVLSARAAEPPLYTIVDHIKVDRHIYKGFLYYGDQCERCHGPEGAGGTFAPDLTASLRHMSRAKFEQTVMDGRKNMTIAVHNVMPSFRPNPDVVENLGNIYVYLKARSDGALRRGHPLHLE